MNISKNDIQQFILISALYFAVPLVTNAEPMTGNGPELNGMHLFSWMKHHSKYCDGDYGKHISRANIGLTVSQQDKLFSIKQAQEQSLYDQEKIVRNAYFDLHKLATSELYDDEKAKAISESLANARATIAYIHAHEEHGIYALLTSEQRSQISSMQYRADE